ncbi:MAG: ispA [Gammaproteobacteria bacterium]|jgi:farnesyl diphosphate synthase|nr:ispA [Gammaproteobacteria bacterium]
MNLDFYRARIDNLLKTHLPQDDSPLSEAIRYATLQGGKRFRPLLVYATGLSFNASLEQLDYPAMAVEIIHAYSLVHDDLPAMDNDLLRRGLPTCHVKFGEALAILAGDAMQALAFDILAANTHPNTLQMLRLLAKACGAEGMAGGQALDLAVVGKNIDENQLQHIHRAKTGKLIKASVALGALCANTPINHKTLEDLGLTLGLAYQIQDDIFDVELETVVRGKQQGADAALNKPTYPAILGMAQAKEKLAKANEQLQQQIQNLQLENSPLANLMAEVIQRQI